MSPSPRPRVLVAGYLSLDRIATPAGTRRGMPGGAALYMALGALRAGAAPVLAAVAGDDWPQPWLDALAARGVDVAGVSRGDGPSRRARLSHAATGERHSRHDEDWWERTTALAPPVPTSLAGLAAVAAGPMPAERLAAFAAAAAGAGLPVLADTSEAFAGAERDALLALLPRLAVFAPSREETRCLLPGLGDDDAALALAALGPAVLQKRGAEGAVLAGPDGSLHRLPAPAVGVIDPTGAGDATVGALAAGVASGLAVPEAARAALSAGALAVSGAGPSALGFDPAPLPSPAEPRGAAA